MAKSRKLPMEQRPTQKERSVSFTKRRQGLFNKAAEMCILCDAQIAVLVASPSKLKPKRKIYSFGISSVPAVVHPFLQNRLPFPLDLNAKNSLISLRNEVESLESELLSCGSGVDSTVEVLDELEQSESVEELQKLVDGFEKIIGKAKARFDDHGSSSSNYANVIFNELNNCNMLSSTEDVVANFKLTDDNWSLIDIFQ